MIKLCASLCDRARVTVPGPVTSGVSLSLALALFASAQEVTPTRRVHQQQPSGAILLAEWDFKEGSGNSVADASGNGHTGTLTNNPAWVSVATVNMHGWGAVQFATATNQCMYSQNFADNLSVFAIDAYFKAGSGLNANNTPGWFDIELIDKVGNGGVQTGNGSWIGGEFLSLDSQQVSPAGFIGPSVNVHPAYDDNNWHCAIAQFFNNQSPPITQLWIDGVPIGNIQGSKTTFGDISNTVPWCVGGNISGPSSGISAYFPGLITHAQVWQGKLTTNQIAGILAGTQ